MADLRKLGPSVNADVMDKAEEARRNALYVLDILVRAYVPKNTDDQREGFAALKTLRSNAGVRGRDPGELMAVALRALKQCQEVMPMGNAWHVAADAILQLEHAHGVDSPDGAKHG